ncbi:MAG: LamG domain-containing protein [Sedimentisphaerales bacterium]
MCRTVICLASFVLIVILSNGPAIAGVDYGDPDGGWTYVYTGDAGAPGADFTALDGTWSHDNGSDSWDESQIGVDLPGGVNVLTEEGVAYVRLQETGDPRDHGASDPSNRKIFFGHQLIDEIDQSVADEILSVGGITISFRARLSTTPPLDDVHPDGGGAVTPWPADGDGYVCHDGGKGSFGVHQEAGGDQTISFALSLASDDDEISVSGLTMNKLNGASPSGDVDLQGTEGGTVNILEIADLTVWHEFWITIEPDTSGGGTHKATIYVDGSSTPNVFHVTSGTGGDFTESYISLGLGATPQSGAIDVDFFAYKEGLVVPVPSNPFLARAVSPTPGSTVGVHEATPFGWTPGEAATQHDMYLGTDEADVNDADTTDTTGIYRGRLDMPFYNPPESLDLGQTYYWRIDEVEADGVTIHKGYIWHFTVLGYLLIDDFESYTDDDVAGETIWQNWIDGFGVAENGAQVGYLVPPYAERTIVHGGSQSMPLLYDNVASAEYSEAVRTLTAQRDWTERGVKALSLWFRGYPPPLGSFTESPAGTYTMAAEGADIAGTSDQFHFAWKEASGAIDIAAKVESIQNTDNDAKAGVMIRDTLDADSAHAMIAVTPGSGIWFGYRDAAGQTTTVATQAGVAAPQWVRLERTIGGLVRAYYSADGASWTLVSTTSTVTMNLPMHVGLALTSHNSGVACQAVFTDVTSSGTGQWDHQDVGLISNDAQPIYVTITNKNGAAGTVYHEDPEATLINTWTQWNVDLRDFMDQGVNLADVDTITIGVGDKDNPQPGSGKMFFDDIQLYPPRYVPDKVTPLVADFTGDGVVNFADLEVMTNDWLLGDSTLTATEPGPALAWWKFDDNANDGGGSVNGTLRGNPTYTAGKVGQAISLDGDDYVDFGNPASLDFSTGDWTICAWAKTTMTGTGDENKGTVFANGGDQTGGIRYTLAVGEVTSGMMTLTTDDDASKIQATGTTPVNDDVWHHVAGIRSGTQLRLYVDGVLEATANVPAGYDLSGTSQHNAYVGVITDNRDATLIKYFIGQIDDVRIYDYALTDSEVLGAMGVTERYNPLTSPANISDDEPANSKSVNFKDFAILADEWLNKLVWPMW